MVLTAPVLKLMGDLYLRLEKRDLAKSTYLASYQKDPHLFSVRRALHRLGVCMFGCRFFLVVESKEAAPSDPLLNAVHQCGLADAALCQHVKPPLLHSPLSLFYQFLYLHDEAQYSKAATSYRSLQTVLPWWQEGVDRFSSVLYVQKEEKELRSLASSLQHFEPERAEVAASRA